MLTLDVLLGLGYVFDIVAQTNMEALDLDHEYSMGTWYSSLKHFLVAALVAYPAWRRFDLKKTGSWSLALLPLMFLAFSMDESMTIHEKLGYRLNQYFGEPGEGTRAHHTGGGVLVVMWTFVPLCLFWMYTLRGYLRSVPDVFGRFVFGMGLFLFGAAAIEVLSNIPDSRETIGYYLEVLTEEMCEMIGLTIIAWAMLIYAKGNGMRLSIDEDATR